jgi:hypothetical protein
VRPVEQTRGERFLDARALIAQRTRQQPRNRIDHHQMLLQRSGAQKQKTIGSANLMGAASQGVVKKSGGSARVYSNSLVEENRKNR